MATTKNETSLNINLPVFLKSLKEVKGSSKLKIAGSGASLVVTTKAHVTTLKKELKGTLAAYQLKRLQNAGTDENPGPFYFDAQKGPLAVIVLPDEEPDILHHEGLLDPSAYGLARDQVGQMVLKFEESENAKLHLHGFKLDYEEMLGALLGLELARYDYRRGAPDLEASASYCGDLPKEALSEILQNAGHIGQAINIGRYLVDIPPSDKRPVTYSKAIENYFDKKAGMTVNVWDEKRLKKEGMGCLLGVGQGSAEPPRLVHLKYRPNKARDVAPLAFVGKGITFDTGGLNVKGGSGMRLMKKDMGGSACLVGLASWVAASKSDIPCDFYLALAENSIDAHSFRPSDILTARNGMTVEIDNTDAEGRLVMADALSVASEAQGKDKPQFLIDVATLTGAIKVGLGDDIGGLFSNNDDLAFILQSCSQISGDPLWRMPLMKSQREKLKSDVADIANSSSGFGGAIRAAMFLQEFTGGIPWAHLDIYAWNSSRNRFYRGTGGSGQAVQCLAQFISQL